MIDFVLGLQEQAEELGFSTVEEALESGFKIVDNKLVEEQA